MSGWFVALRGIFSRPGRSALVMLLAAIAGAATVIAPAYSRAAQHAVLVDQLAAAPADATRLRLRIGADPQEPTRTAAVKAELRQMLNPLTTLLPVLDEPIGTTEADVVARRRASNVRSTAVGAAVDLTTRLVARDGVCAHLTITSGKCADDSGTVVLSDRSARTGQISVGDEITVRAAGVTDPRGGRALRVVGLYAVSGATDPYWNGHGFFSGGSAPDSPDPQHADAAFVGQDSDVAVAHAPLTHWLDIAVRTAAIRLDDLAGLTAELARLDTAVNSAQWSITTGLPAVLADVASEQRALDRTVPIIAVPLVLVSWFVLILLITALAEERAPEVAAARMRGFGVRRAARFGRREPLVLVLIGVALGVGGSIGLMRLVTRVTLPTPVPMEWRWPLLVAAGAAFVTAYLSVRLASAGVFARPVLTLLRTTPNQRRRRTGAAEAALAALAAASLVAASRDRTQPLALLTPALIAFVAGVATGGFTHLWSRLRIRRHAKRGRVTGLLAHASLARRPAGRRVTVVVTVAVALLSFAATAWDVASQARQRIATDAIGAPRMLQVTAAQPDALISALRAVDPGGHTMPVVRATERYGDQSVELLAVDTDAIAEVMLWRGRSREDVTALATRLRPGRVDPLPVTETITIDATARAVSGTPHLAALISAGSDVAKPVDLGAIVAGHQTYRATVPACSTGCRLIGVAIIRPAGGTNRISAALTLTSVGSRSGSLATAFDVAGRWRVDPSRAPGARVTLRPGRQLEIEVTSAEPGDVVVEYAETPAAVPIALAGPAPADDTATADFTFPALGEQPQRFTVVDRPATVPRAGRRTLLFDLDTAVRAIQHTTGGADNSRLRYEVWATTDAPTDLADRLGAVGVTVLKETSLADEEGRLARGASALGLRLALGAGVVALVLAALAVAFTSFVGATARRSELAALGVAGVPRTTLRRAVIREYLHLLMLPLVAGLAAGVVGAVLIAPGLPLVAADTAVGSLTLPPRPGMLTSAAAVMAVTLIIVAFPALRLVSPAAGRRRKEDQP